MEVELLVGAGSLVVTIIGAVITVTWRIGAAIGELGRAVTGLTSEVAGLKNIVNDHHEDFVRQVADLKLEIRDIESNCRRCHPHYREDSRE